MKKRPSKSKTLSHGFRVVALGGGTGLSTLLRGLKELVIRRTDEHASTERPIADLAAIVTVTDDGGSSGRLRRENRILRPATSQLHGGSFERRSSSRPSLPVSFSCGTRSHRPQFRQSFSGRAHACHRRFHEAIRVSSKVLAIRGRIFPSTLSNVHLVATLENGRTVHGETRITASTVPIEKLKLSRAACVRFPWLSKPSRKPT